MIRFAFPNVEILNGEFIGCGRYLAAADPPGAPYSPPVSVIINKATVTRALSLLIYEAGSAEKRVYERKDRSDKKYVGESMHLAYFLAQLNCSRSFHYKKWSGDIWCTGSITIADDKQPVLQEVGHEQEFCLKLQAFLADTQPDRLFLIPAANFQSSHCTICKQHEARLLSLDQFQTLAPLELFSQKTVLLLQTDELDDLIRGFFELGENPYKGLNAFCEEDADHFFGRESLVETIWQKIIHRHELSSERRDASRFLAILGPSGSGKSSLVRAGLIPHIKQQVRENYPNLKVAVFNPGVRPIMALARCLSRVFPQGRLVDFLDRLLTTDTQGNYSGLSSIIAEYGEGPSSPLVLVLDQCEEIYSHCQDEKECKQFIKNLLNAISLKNGALSLLLTLRSDFLERTQTLPEFNNAIVSSSVLVPVMNRTSLRRIIEQPAQLAGYRFQPEIVDRLVAETEGYMGALPLLQFTLTLLWEGLSQGIPPEERLRAIGGVGGALADRAEHLYNALDSAEKRIARKIFAELVFHGETSYTPKRLVLEDIAAYLKNSERVQKILQSFAGAHTRLVTLAMDAEGNRTVELTHETLIHRWKRLRAWLEADHDFHLWRNDLGADIRQWESKNYDKGALLHGALLAEAEKWLQRREYDLNAPEREYIVASQRYFRQEEERWKQLYEKERFSSLEAYHLSSGALFAAHDELGGLLAVVKAGKILQELDTPEELDRRVLATLRKIVYGIREQTRFEGHHSPVQCLRFHPQSPMIVSGSYNGVLKFWNGLSGEEIRSFQAHSDIIRALCFSPDGSLLVTAGDDRLLKLWDVESGKELQHLGGHTTSIHSLAISPDGRLLASGGTGMMIRLWELSQNTEIARLHGHVESIFSLKFSPNGELLASGGADSTVKLWDVEAVKEVNTLYGHKNQVHSLAFHPDGELLASGSADNDVILWKLPEAKRKVTLRGHVEGVNRVSFSPDGKWLASGSGDKTIKLWNVAKQREVTTFFGHRDEVLDVQFSPDGKQLASGSWDTSIKLWNLGRVKITSLKEKARNINCVSFHPEKPLVAAGNDDSVITLWDVVEDRRLMILRGHSEAVWSIAFNPKQDILASGGADDTIKLWQLSDGRELVSLEGHVAPVLSVAFSPDGTKLASGSRDCSIKLWNVADGTKLMSLEGHTEAVWNVRFSPDGAFLASGGHGEDNSVRLWDLRNGELVHTFQVPDWPPAKRGIRLAFHPNGKLLASGSNASGTIHLWDLESFQEIQTLEGHSQTVLSLHFHPEGKILASGSEDNTIKLWDIESGRELTSLDEHSHDVRSVRFSRDGQTLVSGSFDNTIRFWDVAEQCHFDLNELLARGCEWLQSYLRHNPHISDEDRHLCGSLRAENA